MKRPLPENQSHKLDKSNQKNSWILGKAKIIIPFQELQSKEKTIS
jgi:hypothetical protein